MREPLRIVLEAMLVSAIGAGAGLAINAMRANGVELDRDTFGSIPVRAADADAHAQEQAVRARLAALGVEVLDHDAVAALFHDELYEEGAYVFIDARNEEKWRAGHIPGALLLDHYQYQRTIDRVMPAIQTAAKVVVYCYGKDCIDSELCAQLLKNFDVDPAIIAVYLGGFQTWQEHKLPVETGDAPP